MTPSLNSSKRSLGSSTSSLAVDSDPNVNDTQEMKVLTGVPIVKHDPVMDVSHLGYSGLHLLKMNDPFMYYSIPGAKNLTEEDLDQMLPSLVMGNNSNQDEEQVQRPRNRRRSLSDSHLLVRRSSRISYETYPDLNSESLSIDVAEVRAHFPKRRRSSYEMELSQVDRAHRCGSVLQGALLEMFKESFLEEEGGDSDNEEL